MTTVPARQPEAQPPQRTESAGADGARGLAPAVTPATRVLALQRAAGNRAVATLLARDPAPKAPPAKPAPAPPTPKTHYAVVPGVGTIPLQSISFGAVYHGSGGEAPSQPQKKPDIHLTSEQGPHTEALFKASLWGEPADVEIVFVREGTPYMRIKLKAALVSSLHISGPGGWGDKPIESWTLTYESIETVTEKPAPAGGG